MWHLFEGLWYSLLIILKICWLPALIIIVVALLARLYGTIKRAAKNKDKK